MGVYTYNIMCACVSVYIFVYVLFCGMCVRDFASAYVNACVCVCFTHGEPDIKTKLD